MLFHLLPQFSDDSIVFNLFRYQTFRAMGAVVTALLVAFVLMRSLPPGVGAFLFLLHARLLCPLLPRPHSTMVHEAIVMDVAYGC